MFVGGLVSGLGTARRRLPSPGDGSPWRRGRREEEEGDGGLISRALKVEGLKCKKTNVLPPRHVFWDGGSTWLTFFLYTFNIVQRQV